MSKLIVSTAMAVDGVMSLEGWYVPGGERDRAAMEQFERAAALVLGERTSRETAA